MGVVLRRFFCIALTNECSKSLSNTHFIEITILIISKVLHFSEFIEAFLKMTTTKRNSCCSSFIDFNFDTSCRCSPLLHYIFDIRKKLTPRTKVLRHDFEQIDGRQEGGGR